MKKFIAILGLFTMITSHAATISTTEVKKIENKIEMQKEEFNEKTAYPVGNKNFVAVSSVQIEALINKAQQMLTDLIADKNLSEKEISEKINEINYFLSASENLIYGLPY